MSRLDQFYTRPHPENSTIAVLRHAQKHKASRAPMVNPYDKFTQPEFDAWIGDMTTSIRRALGFEQEEPCLLENTHVNAANGRLPQYPQLDLSDQDEVPDDSFAQLKTRRDKGKARDPREGPGLGRDRTQPIEVVSSDEEDEDEVKALALSHRVDNPDVYDQAEGPDYLWERSSPSSHLFSSPPTKIGPPLRSRQKGDVEDSDVGSGDDEYEDEDEDFVNHNDSSEVISISSDGDESVDEEDDYLNRPGPSSSRYPRDKSDEEDEELGADDEVDEIQPLDDDTSFPPRHSSPHRNLQLNDPWEGPRKYAEDYYSGGELQFPAEVHVHPDHLGPLDGLDGGIETVDEVSRPDEIDHSEETPSSLRSASEFYQAYYSEGNTIPLWGQQLDPRLFARAEVDDDIESFLTPGVLTPNQSELRTHIDETEDAVETAFRNERAQLLPPSVLPLRRNEPIPRDAEIIAIDDSDDDGEDNLVVVPPLDAILEMVTGPATGHPEGPEVPNGSSPFVPVENIGDEVLSVHTAHTEDIEHESCLQPLEIVEPEAADSTVDQESLTVTFDFEPVPSGVSDLELEEQYNPEMVEPEVLCLNAVDTLPLDTRSKSIAVEVDEPAPNYYEDFDDIYEIPAPETLPLHSSEGGSQIHEDTNPSDDSGLALRSAGNVSIEVNYCEVSSTERQPPRIENNGVSNDIVPESSIEENSLETSRTSAIDVDIQNPVTPKGLSNAVSTLSSPKAEESMTKTPEFATNSLPVLLSPSRISTVPGQPQIPMPVMADASVPDPTESPTRLQEHAILSIPGTPDIPVVSLQTPQVAGKLEPAYPSFPFGPLLHALNSNADGLFTPADFSTPTTPAEDNSIVMLPSGWHEADVTSSATVAPVDLQVQAELTDKPDAPLLKQGFGDILIETDVIASGRKSVLMADPYPYCLSTPILSLSDDASSENGDNSICSHSTPEKENEREEQPIFPFAADMEPHIDSQPTTEHEDIPALLMEFDLRVASILEEPNISPTLNEKDSLVGTDPFQATMGLEDSIPTDVVVEDSRDRVTATSLQPLEAGVDADLQAGVQENLEEKKETDFTIPEDSNPQAYEVKKDATPQATEAASRPSKRKRETSPDGPGGFLVKSKSKPRARGKGKRRAGKRKEAETDVVEQPPVHDTIYVTSPKHRKRGSATSENSRKVDVGGTHFIDKFHAPPLFHAHGRTKRQKSHTQPIASDKQTRDYADQPAPQSTSQHTSVKQPSRDPSPLEEHVVPTTAGAITTGVRQASQSPALLPEPSQLKSTTMVATAPSPTQAHTTTFSRPSSTATVDGPSQPTPTATVAPSLTPSLQSSPARFLQVSNSASSIRSTRSQCKYHKITLPIGEKGPRVCFMVPGCSLSNQELMNDEDIEDQGEATYEDSLRIVQNIDHLDFDAYLIGTLRQLVGLDILREGEVFYLPQPGDDVPIKHWPRKSLSERTSTAKGSDFASFPGSPGYSYSGSARSPSTRPPLSNADSAFTSLPGLATTDESDMGNQSPFKGKISRQITSQYQEHDEELPDKESISTTRGIKRTRTHDGATGNDGTRKSKRLRLHLTDSSLHQTQQHD